MTSIFVTGGSGFIGSAFVPRAVAAGYTVRVLSRSQKSGERLQAAGAIPVVGDILRAEDWQQAASQADFVVHLAQPETYGARVTLKRAQNYRDQRLCMDELLLSSLNPATVRRVIYVAGTSYYGDQGSQLVNENTKPNPKGFGPFIAPAIERLEIYRERGLPILEAYPGWVYGPGSWFLEYNLTPLKTGKRISRLTGPIKMTSPVHVEDVGRALVHLLEKGTSEKRYFIVDDQPVLVKRLPEVTAQALRVPLRFLSVPEFIARLLLGPIVTESLTTEFRLSNTNLKETGFEFEFPTIEKGIPDVVSRWQAQSKEK